MGILLDIGFVIIILLCVVFGYKKGFFKSIAGFIGAVHCPAFWLGCWQV